MLSLRMNLLRSVSGSLATLALISWQWDFASLETLSRRTAALIPNHKVSQSFSSPSYFRNWGLSNQFKSHIHAVDAWKIEDGNRDIIVAVIDTGVDSTHPSLSSNMWRDPKVANKSVYGWNFVTNEPNPSDDHGHGTHVAGIIGAIAQPKTGVSGVAREVSIMAVKYYSEKNPGAVNLANTVKAINYAVDQGARIINYSGGGPEFSEEEYLAIRRAEEKGVLFISAAGNEHQDIDKVENYYYPSAYGLSNIVSVAATDINNKLLGSSNWGKKKVDLAAPGEGIYSTLPGGRFGSMTGTSQATAFVSGVAALLLSRDPSLTPQQVKAILMKSADRIPELAERLATGGRVNAHAALVELESMKLTTLAAAQRPSRKPVSISQNAAISSISAK